MSQNSLQTGPRSSQRKPLYLVYIKCSKALSLLHRAHYELNLLSRKEFEECIDDVVEFLELCNDYKPFGELPDVEDDSPEDYTETEDGF